MNRIWDLGKFAENIALQDEAGKTLTYAGLEGEGRRLAGQFPGRSLVFILCRNEIGSVVGYTACVNSGAAVPVMLSSHLEEGLLRNLLESYSPEYLWVPEEMEERFPGAEAVYEAWGYTLLKTAYGKRWPLFDELALLVTTSGSTGSPKLVRQSYMNLRDNAGAIAEYLRLDETERPITTLPMNYVYGISILNSHLLTGGTLLLTDKGLMQKEFWAFFREAGATSFGGVPYTFEMLDKLRFTRMKLDSLRTVTQAGGKLDPELHGKFAAWAAETGRHFVVMYGAAEATSRMGYLPPERAVEKKGSMGIPIPGGKLALGDERHGRLETGDMAQFDADGFYYIVGRKKRFLKIYGNRVNLDEVDRMIREAFHTETASAGRDDRLTVFVTEAEKAEGIREFLAGKTKLNPAAFRVKVIPEIPKNEAGKTLYSELEKYDG